MSLNITQPSFAATAGNMLYNNLGFVCLTDPTSCLPAAPKDFCSALSFGAFSAEVAIAPLALLQQPAAASLAFVSSQLTRWVESSYCFPATTSFQQNGTEVPSTLANVALLTRSSHSSTKEIVTRFSKEVITNTLQANPNPFSALGVGFKELNQAGSAMNGLDTLANGLQANELFLLELQDKLAKTAAKLGGFENLRQRGAEVLASMRDVPNADQLKDLFGEIMKTFSFEDSTKLSELVGKLSNQPRLTLHEGVGSLKALLEKLVAGYDAAATNAARPAITTEINRQVSQGETQTQVLAGAQKAVGKFALISQFARNTLYWAVSLGSALQRQHDINARYTLQSNATGAAEAVPLKNAENALAKTDTCSDGSDTCSKPITGVVKK